MRCMRKGYNIRGDACLGRGRLGAPPRRGARFRSAWRTISYPSAWQPPTRQSAVVQLDTRSGAASEIGWPDASRAKLWQPSTVRYPWRTKKGCGVAAGSAQNSSTYDFGSGLQAHGLEHSAGVSAFNLGARLLSRRQESMPRHPRGLRGPRWAAGHARWPSGAGWHDDERGPGVPEAGRAGTRPAWPFSILLLRMLSRCVACSTRRRCLSFQSGPLSTNIRKF